MTRKRFGFMCSCLPVALIHAAHAAAEVQVAGTSCEYAANPISVGTKTPRFSWVLDSTVRDQVQSAYQVLVADSEEALNEDRGTIWDSGRVESSQSVHVPFDGQPLESNRTYHWKVRVWDKNGAASPYSQTASFSMALLVADDWRAKWIGRGPAVEPKGPEGFFNSTGQEAKLEHPVEHDGRSTLLRKEFDVDRTVRRARVYVCGPGLYELYLNGAKVGEDVLMPPKTHYGQRVLYNTYDVTEGLQEGRNAFGIMLGNGWFNPYKKWWSWRMQWWGSQRVILQMHIDYTDGTSEIVVSDGSWRASTGAVTHSCIFDGETYDANLEQPGWDTPGFDDATWSDANVVEAPAGELTPQAMEPIRVTETIKPVALSNPKPGVWVFDMGQNFAGWPRLTVDGPKGTTVTLRHAENIGEGGMLDRRSMGMAEATATYTLKGGGVEVYEPRFTFFGFRYVEVTGFPGTPGLETLEGRVVHSACRAMGSFECGNELINRIHRCTLWSQRSNMLGYPMDCPQREERLGWLGDAHVTAEEAMHNFHMPLFYRSWLKGIQLDQQGTGDVPYISPRPYDQGKSPAWSSAYILIPWYHYVHYGDAQVLAEHYESMKRYVDYLGSTATDYILPKDRYGDWVSVAYNWGRGDPESTSTGYFYYFADVLAKVAEVLGRPDDHRHYTQLAASISDAYNARFFDAEAHQYENGSQFSNAFPLFLGITPPPERKAVLRNLVEDIVVKEHGHLTTGILGSKYMMEMLSREGEGGVAYLLASQTDYPSWGNLIENRTTLSERWPQTGSNNHVMFGSVDAWFYRVLGGICADESHPGFEHVVIKPYCQPDVGWVRASVDTVRGTIRSNWAIQGDTLSLEVGIPVNVRATVLVPTGDAAKVTEGGQPLKDIDGVRLLRMAGDCAVVEVGSGSYSFLSRDVGAILPMAYAARPEILPEQEIIDTSDTVTVDMISGTGGARIHYTLDGTEPTEDSPRFLQPFALDQSGVVKARAFREGYLPSVTRSHEYQFVTPGVNGLDYEFYEGAFTELPDFDALEPDREGHVYLCDLDEIGATESHYALRFRGRIEIAREGEYTFFTLSNDGSQLFVNGELVVDNDGEHGSIEKNGTVHLASGFHPFTVTYFQSGGAWDLRVLYQGPGVPKRIVPASKLRRAQ